MYQDGKHERRALLSEEGGKRNRGRSRKRWLGTVKLGLNEFGIES